MLAVFLDQLFQSGQIQLATALPLHAAETAAIDRLKQEEISYRQDFPGTAPEFSLEACYWAATILYRAAQFFSARDLPAEAVRADLSVPCPVRADRFDAIYSVDIAFRYLPDVYKLAVTRASADPLVSELTRLSDTWPLSGVGVPAGATRTGNVCHFKKHKGLVRLYLDRIEAVRDYSLLTDEKLGAMARADCEVHYGICCERMVAAPATTPHQVES